jgi:hypothetical protein
MRLENKINKQDLDVVILTSLNEDPYLSGQELVGVVANQLGTQLSISTIQRARKRLGFSRKVATRSHRHQSAPSNHPLFSLNDAYGGNVIAVDECGFVSTDRPTRGWCKRSERLPKPSPKGRTRHSLLLAICRHGVVSYEIRKGTFNGEGYANFLKTLPQGARLLADNASIHKTKAVKATAAAMNIELAFIPPYSPWFNPVEFAFSIAKRTFQNLRVREVGNMDDQIRDSIITSVTPLKCEHFFEHSKGLWTEKHKEAQAV